MRLAYNLNRAFPDIAFRNTFQPPALMLDVLNLEFQQRGQFAGEHPVTLLVAVLHGLNRFVVGHFTDDKGHFIQPGQLATVGAAMARYNFVAVPSFSGRARPGTITPFTRIEATISCIFASSRTLKGCGRNV